MNSLGRWLGSDDEPMSRQARAAVVFLFVLAVLMSGANLFWTSHEVGRVSRVSATLTSEHEVQLYACGLTNQSRAEELRLWRHIIEIAAPPPHQTRAEKKARHALMAGFVSYLKRVFRNRNCAAIYHLRH